MQLQIVDYERFSELSQGNRFRIEPLPPTRGIIYDRNGLVIAENLPNWELVAVGEEIDDLERRSRRSRSSGSSTRPSTTRCAIWSARTAASSA